MLRKTYVYLATRSPLTQFQQRMYIFEPVCLQIFLQVLTMGTALVGLAGGIFSVHRFFHEQHEKDEREKSNKAEHAVDRLLRRFEDHNFTYALRVLKIYKQGMERKCVEVVQNEKVVPASSSSWFWSSAPEKTVTVEQTIANVQGAKHWAQLWLDARNNGDADAKSMEFYRTQCKASMYMVKAAIERNPERLDLFKELLYEDPLNKYHVGTFIKVIREMDYARCISHSNCVWERDEPHIFAFLEQLYGLEKPAQSVPFVVNDKQ